MAFQPELWTRFIWRDLPVYVRGDRPDWFVPNEAGDRVLQEYAQTGLGLADAAVQRFLARLPDGPPRAYAGRAEVLVTDHLRELWFHLTNRCNQACRHCLFASSPAEHLELSASRVKDLAAQAAALGCRVFSLTGGEPLVHPEFEGLVDILLGFDDAHVVVLTNGTLVREYAMALARWPASRFHLQISVDGLDARHDQVRGAGAFQALVANLAWLRSQGLAFTLSMCVTAENLVDMVDVVDFAAAHGAANLHFMWYFVRGRGKPQGFAPPERILPRLVAAAEQAARIGLSIDNIQVLRSQVFAPPGTIHDGATGGWESLAVGPDGRLYPSPALVGVADLATEMSNGLARAWRHSAVLEECRRATARNLASPWRFLLGGGDPDHSYLHGGRFVGSDPYWRLYEELALWLIAREAAGLPAADGLPRLRLRMGDVLESCGSQGSVALTHSNCLLAAATPDSRTVVQEFYKEAAADTKTEILNPVRYPEELISHIPAAFRFRGYGCGSPVLDAGLQPGMEVLDLGCGAGVECFIAARLVGPAGRVIGVDMLDSMLATARQGAAAVAADLGYDNLEFKRGYLEELPLPESSVDVVLSNCVLNLSGHKRRTFGEIFRVLRPGGRLVIADVVAEEEPGAALRNDAQLKAECIAGALTQRDLFGLLEESGFVASRVLKRFPYRIVQGHPFFSLTFDARRPVAASKVRVLYRGPFSAVITGRGEILPVGVTRETLLDELPAASQDMFVFGRDGAVDNIALPANACCPPPNASGAAVQASLTAAMPTAMPNASGCCPYPLESPDAPAAGIPLAIGDSPAATRHRSGCLACGAPLHYLGQEALRQCLYCRRLLSANAVCAQGHFVCDACHTGDAMALMEHICLTTPETDMIALMAEIRRHPAMPLHGPEHHAMVPGIILATNRNLGGATPPAALSAALQRGRSLAGGSCAFLGVCGAVTGVGAAFSLLLEANPLKPGERLAVQKISLEVLRELTAFQAARCCQRDCWLALKKAAELSRKYLAVPLRAESPLLCRQAHLNKECLGAACPLWAKV
jgi:7,8-dihydro-6-hydroxymethylpterin dimethyltransferase